VKGIFDPVHPVQSHQFHPTHLREEIDLLSDILRANGKVMNPIW
jgi:hypothetical protein